MDDTLLVGLDAEDNFKENNMTVIYPGNDSLNTSTNNNISNTNGKGVKGDLRNMTLFASPDCVTIREQQPPSSISPAQEGEEQKQCNCKMSKCLKLYCECFAVLGYCGDHCRCIDCFNRPDMENVRQEAVQATKDRNNSAFITKVVLYRNSVK